MHVNYLFPLLVPAMASRLAALLRNWSLGSMTKGIFMSCTEPFPKGDAQLQIVNSRFVYTLPPSTCHTDGIFRLKSAPPSWTTGWSGWYLQQSTR